MDVFTTERVVDLTHLGVLRVVVEYSPDQRRYERCWYVGASDTLGAARDPMGGPRRDNRKQTC